MLNFHQNRNFTVCKTRFLTYFPVESVENYDFQVFFSSKSVENSVENVKNGFIIGFSNG